MTYRTILKSLFARDGRVDSATPQSHPLPGQVANNAGGWFHAVDDWARLDRFLILGSDSGTFYVSPVRLTRENADAALRCLVEDGARVVRRIVEISESGRAPRNDSALFALALASAAEDGETRRIALDALPRVARTGTHVLQFAAFVDGLRGWGRGLRRGVGRWFNAMPAERLALQAVKYRQRDGWSLRDLLRLAHPLTDDMARRVLIDWIAHPDDGKAITGARDAFPLVNGLHVLRETGDVNAAADAIVRYSLPRETVPTELLDRIEIWDALLVDMPMTAMIRNLGKMSAVGLVAPFSEAARYVAERLGDVEQRRRARVHPVQLLLALKTYARGRGVRGGLRWEPVPPVVDALDMAFERSFEDVEPTSKRILVGVDVSGSMATLCSGASVLTANEAAAAFAMQLFRVETECHVIAFDTVTHLPALSARQRLDDVVRTFAQWSGGTDVAQPFLYALANRLPVDAIVILTDHETWAGNIHVVEALRRYRARVNPDLRVVTVAAAANHGSVVPEDDALALGVCGFDAAVPRLVGEFLSA